jgi:hypothetical protein
VLCLASYQGGMPKIRRWRHQLHIENCQRRTVLAGIGSTVLSLVVTFVLVVAELLRR